MATCLLAKVDRLLYYFPVLVPFRAFAVCLQVVFRCKYFFADVLFFSCIFLALVAFLQAQLVLLLSLSVFLLWFLLCCFAVFALFLRSVLWLTFVFSLRQFLVGALRFPCIIFVFLARLSCKIDVLLCTFLQVCLWVFPVLVSVSPFPLPPFASLACF